MTTDPGHTAVVTALTDAMRAFEATVGRAVDDGFEVAQNLAFALDDAFVDGPHLRDALDRLIRAAAPAERVATELRERLDLARAELARLRATVATQQEQKAEVVELQSQSGAVRTEIADWELRYETALAADAELRAQLGDLQRREHAVDGGRLDDLRRTINAICRRSPEVETVEAAEQEIVRWLLSIGTDVGPSLRDAIEGAYDRLRRQGGEDDDGHRPGAEV